MKTSALLSRPPGPEFLAPPSSAPPAPAARQESVDAVLARNLVAARQAAGVTQQGLAATALVSRPTVAQLDTGYSDPRLSTIVDLARALGVPPIFLLPGVDEVTALTALPRALANNPLRVPSADLERMQRLLRTGMLKDRVRAAFAGAMVARGAGHDTPAAVVSAAIFSALVPGPGTAVGAALGELMTPAGP